MPSALATLRAATADVHDRLEATLAIARPDADASVYVEYLRNMLGWLDMFENSLWASEWPADMTPELRDGKCGWIRNDLRHFGMSDAAINTLPHSAFRPDLTSCEARLGLAYVVEGAQLGGQVLAKRFVGKLPPERMRWLQGYGSETSKRWKAFVEYAEEALPTDRQRESAADAARQAFLSLADWFEQRHNSRQKPHAPEPATTIQE
jgi:heme oxygenase